jgi:prepilin-type N-terminal cleavage/methylation domain-containing protein/prepilin-type processing-associated H-X9-DG protein
MKKRTQAFTLIELLVVIAIIAILAAILFPVFAKAKEAAKKSADVSNIKQLSLSQLNYAADNDDMFSGSTMPRSGASYITGARSNNWGRKSTLGWLDSNGGAYNGYSAEAYKGVALWTRGIEPYIKNRQILVGPNDYTRVHDEAWNGNPECARLNYVMNAMLSGASSSMVPDSANLIMYRSHGQSYREPYTNPQAYGLNKTTPVFAISLYTDASNYLDKSFGNGANYGWADGHVKYRLCGTITYYELGITDRNRSEVYPGGAYYYFNSIPWRNNPTF